MLVKLAFVMQRLKKYLKNNFCHDQQRWGGGQFLDFMGDTAVMRGDMELMAPLPVPPSTRENPDKLRRMFLMGNKQKIITILS